MAMHKEVICVYQDCVLCGDRGKKVQEFAVKSKISIRKVGFTTPEGRHLIHEAVFKHKMGSMPFFTDGEMFSYSLRDFVKNEQVKTKRKSASRKKRKAKKVEAKDESTK